jgi:hypothetical protein
MIGVQHRWKLKARSFAVGLGAPIDTIAAAITLPSLSDPYKILRQFWGQVQGRSWDQAITSAYARASSEKWVASDQPSRADLITLLVASAVNSKLMADVGNLDVANDLSRTWYVIAQRMGIGTSKTEVDKAKQQAIATGNVEIGIPIIIAAVIGEAIIVVGVTAVLMYFASQVIDDVLSKIVCDRELVRLHSAYNKIVEKHSNDPKLPWTDDDRKMRDQLVEQQKFVASGCVKPKPGIDPWPYVLGAGIVGTTAVALVYRKEIGEWLSRRMR